MNTAEKTIVAMLALGFIAPQIMVYVWGAAFFGVIGIGLYGLIFGKTPLEKSK